MLQNLMRLARRKDGVDHDPRRREFRYEVEISAEILVDGNPKNCTISDLSSSGALVTVDAVLTPGATVRLQVPTLGDVDAQVMHAGNGFCGVQFLNPEKNRDRIESWLRKNSA